MFDSIIHFPTMHTTTRNFILAVIAALVLLVGGTLLATRTPRTTRTPEIAATIFPVFDIARNVAGDTQDIALILPAGVSPHTFELTPRQALNLSEVETVFAIGNNLDGWADQVSAISDAEIVHVDENVALTCTEEEEAHDHDEHGHEDHEEEEHDDHHGHDHGPCDPHYWLDANNAIGMAEQIRDAFIVRDPDNEDIYRENTANYIAELELLDDEINATLETLDTRDLISFHDAFEYFADAYDLNIRGTFESSPGKDVTPQQLARLEELVSVYTIGALFTEPQLSKSALQAFADDNDLPIHTLDPIGGVEDRTSYVNLMRFNAESFKNALTQ